MQSFIDWLALGIAATSLVASVVLTIRSQRQQKRLRHLESEQSSRELELRRFQGSKEEVTSVALKYLETDLPSDATHRGDVISALVQAALFEGSDRARSVVFGAIGKHYSKNRTKFDTLILLVNHNLAGLEKLGFDQRDLDTASARRRLGALEKLLERHRNAT